MKQLLFLLLLLPALALAQKAAPPSVIAGQPRRDFVQDSTIAANKAATPTSASAINAVSATTYASDKAAQGVLDGAQSTSIASVSAQVGANTTAIGTISTVLLGKIDFVQIATYSLTLTYITAYEAANTLANRRTFLLEILTDESTSPSGNRTLYRYVPTDPSPKLRSFLEL